MNRAGGESDVEGGRTARSGGEEKSAPTEQNLATSGKKGAGRRKKIASESLDVRSEKSRETKTGTCAGKNTELFSTIRNLNRPDREAYRKREESVFCAWKQEGLRNHEGRGKRTTEQMRLFRGGAHVGREDWERKEESLSIFASVRKTEGGTRCLENKNNLNQRDILQNTMGE